MGHVLRAQALAARSLAKLRDREGAALLGERGGVDGVGDVPHVEDVVRREVRRATLERELTGLWGVGSGAMSGAGVVARVRRV